MSASASKSMGSPRLSSIAEEKVKSDFTLDLALTNHPYDVVIDLLSNIKKENDGIRQDVADFAETLHDKLSSYRDQGRVVTIAHLQDTIQDVQRYEEEVLEKIKSITEGLGEAHVQSCHGPETTAAVQLIVSKLKEAEAFCIHEPLSAEAVELLLNGMKNRYEQELEQHLGEEKKNDITKHYNILSRRAALLLNFRPHGYSRRTTSIIGMAFAITDTVKNSIEKHLNEVEKAGQEICGTYAGIKQDEDYDACCKVILKKSQDTLRMMMIHALLEKQDGKTDFRCSQLRKLIESLEEPKHKKTIRSRSAMKYFAEKKNKKHFDERTRLLDGPRSDESKKSASASSVKSRGRPKSRDEVRESTKVIRSRSTTKYFAENRNRQLDASPTSLDGSSPNEFKSRERQRSR